MAVERVVRQVDSVEEIWETTGFGMIYVKVSGVDGKERSLGVGGKPGQKLRISEYDRMRNQEVVMDEKADVFTNGMLLRVDADQNDDPMTKTDQVLTAEDIVEIFGLTGKSFTERVDQLNEYNARRLLAEAETLDATNSQIQALKAMVETKWRIGGEMPIYRELQSLGEVASPSH